MFFATASDLVPLLASLEAQQSLQYTLLDLSKVDDPLIYQSYAEIPDFGIASHPTAVANPQYLVCHAGTAVRVQPVPQQAGGIRFAIDPEWNPDTVALRPGGRYGSNAILYGSVGTVMDSAISKDLYRFLAKPFGRNFQKHDAFYIGPEALKLWRDGVRLTTAANSPPEYDLKE